MRIPLENTVSGGGTEEYHQGSLVPRRKLENRNTELRTQKLRAPQNTSPAYMRGTTPNEQL